jgi:hypothetical protein
MATTYTQIWRLAVMQPGDPNVKNSWGTIQDSTMPLMEQGAVGNTPISIAALTSYTLSTADNAADQGRLALYNFIGAITGDCTVTIPAVARIGWVTNSTTGTHNVILTTGSGTSLTVAPGFTYFWTCDGTNIASPSGALTSLNATGNVTVGGTLGVTGAAATVRPIQLQTGAAVRWQLQANAATEGGGNVGSDLELWSYTDAGAALTKVVSIVRSTGVVSIAEALNVGGTLSVSSGSISLSVTGGDADLYLRSVGGSGRQYVVGSTTSGFLQLYDATASAARMLISPAGDAAFLGNVTVNSGYNLTITQGVLSSTLNGTGSNNLNLFRDTAGAFIGFFWGGSGIGSIYSADGATTVYATTSDQDLKIKVGPIEFVEAAQVIERIVALWYVWKADPGSEPCPGFFAQQIYRICPWAVVRGRGRPGSKRFRPWQMDASKLMPFVIAYMQGLGKRITALEKAAR